MEIIIFFLRGKFEKLNENYEKYGSIEEFDKIELLLLLFYMHWILNNYMEISGISFSFFRSAFTSLAT